MNRPDIRNTNYYPVYFFLIALFLYWPSLRVYFCLDDLQFLLRACGIDEFPGTFKRIVSTKFFFQAGWHLFGTAPQYYHLAILLLHAANAWLVYLVSRRAGAGERAGVFGALLFLMAPVAFTPMHWISGIQEVSMTFFALIAACFYLRPGNISMAFSLIAALLSLLCKETSLFLVPGLAFFFPTSPRRRWLFGLGGIVIALIFLAKSGGLIPRPAGDPYETAFGTNIFWNVLTYSGWMARFWDYFPDRIPQYQSGLALWGSILPLALMLVAWRYRSSRRAMGKTLILFFLFLAPVLPLIRHSYFYYLYLPLIPVWILAGMAMDKLTEKRYAYMLLAGFFMCSWATGVLHRRSEIQPGVLSDPFLRYAGICGHAVREIRDIGEVRKGDYLFLKNPGGKSVDLAQGLEGRSGTERKKVHLFKQALLGGKGLRVFYPEIESVHFEDETGAVAGWEKMHFFWAYGLAEVMYLGYGREGRKQLIDYCVKAGLFDRAAREIDIMLQLDPDDVSLRSLKDQIDGRAGK